MLSFPIPIHETAGNSLLKGSTTPLFELVLDVRLMSSPLFELVLDAWLMSSPLFKLVLDAWLMSSPLFELVLDAWLMSSPLFKLVLDLNVETLGCNQLSRWDKETAMPQITEFGGRITEWH